MVEMLRAKASLGTLCAACNAVRVGSTCCIFKDIIIHCLSEIIAHFPFYNDLMQERL